MAKQTRAIRGVNIPSQQGKNASFEHHESYDDSLLPDAIELSKLQQLDGTMIEWVKQRTATEQDARLDYNSRKMGVYEKLTSRTFKIDVLSILVAAIIMLAGMFLSAFLIHKNLTIAGSLFGGGTIITAAIAFLNYNKRNRKQ
jgi:uncharacterized protein YhaN